MFKLVTTTTTITSHRRASSFYCYKNVLICMDISLLALKNVNNCLNTNIYFYLQTFGGQSSNQY